MIRRTIAVGNPARLSIAHRQLVIERDGFPKATIPCEDIGVLIVDNPQVSYTHAVFTSILEAGGVVVLCGDKHLPCGLMYSLEGHYLQTEHFKAQIEAPEPLKKQLWKEVIKSKISQQALVLRTLKGDDGGIKALGDKVKSGDSENAEAQAAQRYWPRLFGPDFRRERSGEAPNFLLNYGYIVLRSAMARALVGAGLIPTLGLHHHNRYNAFCLADDLMEPYRPYVDLKVYELWREAPERLDLDNSAKKVLLGLLNLSVVVKSQTTPLLLAIQHSANSLRAAFSEGKSGLALPSGLFVDPRETEEAEE